MSDWFDELVADSDDDSNNTKKKKPDTEPVVDEEEQRMTRAFKHALSEHDKNQRERESRVVAKEDLKTISDRVRFIDEKGLDAFLALPRTRPGSK